MGMSYDSLFPSRFIKAGEMNGKPVTMTIADVYLDHLEQEDGREKPQAVVKFAETKREFALNKTNGQCLLAMFGPDSGNWIGKRITLVAERDPSGLSDSGMCLRIKGSPDITKQITAEIRLPRRRPQKRTLVPTGKTPPPERGAAPVTAVEPETGEVFDGYDAEDDVSAATIAADAFADVAGSTSLPDDGVDADDDLAELDAFTMDADAARAQREALEARRTRAKATPGTLEGGEAS